MRSLLRADWLRFRRRRDFWIIASAVLIFGALSFISAYRSAVVDPEYPTEAQIRQEALDFGFFEGTPDEVAAMLDQYVADQLLQNELQRAQWEEQQAVELQKYAFPQSVFTLIGPAIVPLLALVLLASLAVGDEFRYGTIRTSLLAASDRRRFLIARLVTLLVMTVAIYLALAVLATVLGVGLAAAGAELGVGSTPVDAVSALAWLGGHVLITMAIIALGTALTVVLRSGALPILLIIIAGFVELFLANLPIFAPGQLLAGVPMGFLGWSMRTLTARLGYATHGLALTQAEVPFSVVELPLLVVAATIAAWGVLFLVAADRRLRRMDIVE